MPIFDCECKECGQITEQFLKTDEQPLECPVCKGETKRVFTKMTFKLVYNNKTDVCAWGADNYETSQYWSKVNEARDRGEDVKPITEK